MNLVAEKIKLSQLILNIESEQLIKKIKTLIKTEEADLWDTYSDELKNEISLSLKELDNGEGVKHAGVMKKIEKWRKK